MRRKLLLRNSLAMSSAFAGLLALAALGVDHGARAQDEAPKEKADAPKEKEAEEAPKAEAPKAAPLPAVDQFIQAPETPLDFWDDADFLIRSGQVKQAVPYLNEFLKRKPDDDTLVLIRDRYGIGSVLQLDKFPETRALAPKVVALMNAAVKRHATRPERLERFIHALTKSKEEQAYAVARLSEAGSEAVPFLVKSLRSSRFGSADHSHIVLNMGRLDPSAVPALIAVLDSTDSRLVADAADALGRIGDLRAVPQLTYLGAVRTVPARGKEDARRAVAALTGRPFDSQALSPVRLLTAEAMRYHRHQVRMSDEPVTVWEWDEAQQSPVSRQVTRSEAEAIFGIKYARNALALDPTDRPAQVALVSLALEKAVERGGYPAFPGSDTTASYTLALAAGPEVLGMVVRGALDDGKMDLAAVATTAFGQVSDANALALDRRPNALVEALSAPSRRVRYAAARSLIVLNPHKAFPGSSRVVSTLAPFLTNQPQPRAVIIDGNRTRAGQLAGFLKELGYDPEVAVTGRDGFRAAAERADVELILLDPHLTQGVWRVVDTVSNLRADARTAGIPIFIYGPLDLDSHLHALKTEYPGIKYIVQPVNSTLLEQQLGGRPESLTTAERAGYASGAASLLAQIAQDAGSPFEPDLVRVAPELAVALKTPPTSLAASTALGDVPLAEAQRGLADTLLAPSAPAPLRLSAGAQLVHSIQRFGPLVAAAQEENLVAAFDAERDPALRAIFASVIGALKPRPILIGVRLRQYRGSAAGTPPSASPSPESVPSPPIPEANAKPPAAIPAPPAPGTEAKP